MSPKTQSQNKKISSLQSKRQSHRGSLSHPMLWDDETKLHISGSWNPVRQKRETSFLI